MRLISEATTDQLQKPQLWRTWHAGEASRRIFPLKPTEVCATFFPPESQTKVGLPPVWTVGNQPSMPTWVKRNYRWICSLILHSFISLLHSRCTQSWTGHPWILPQSPPGFSGMPATLRETLQKMSWHYLLPHMGKSFVLSMFILAPSRSQNGACNKTTLLPFL